MDQGQQLQPQQTVGKEDLWDVRNQLTVLLKDGFFGLNNRLDLLNGRTRKVETLAAIHSWAIGIIGAVGLALLGGMVAIAVHIYTAP